MIRTAPAPGQPRPLDLFVLDTLARGCDVTGSTESVYTLIRGPLADGQLAGHLTTAEHEFLKRQAGAIVFESADGRRIVTYYPGNETWQEDPQDRLQREWSSLMTSYNTAEEATG